VNTLLLAPFLDIGFPELLLVFGIALLLFGGAKLKGIGRGMGEAINEFKKGMNGEGDGADKNAPPAEKK
jgi:sec-independent protein translocase protein TatA